MNTTLRDKKGRKRRACFLYYQGFGQLLHREAIALKSMEFEVDVICLKNFPEEMSREMYDGLQVFKIQSRAQAEKTVFGYFVGLGLFFFKAFFLLSYLSIRNRYDIIHFTSPPDIAIFTAIVPKLLGAKVILDIHDIGPELFMRKLGVSNTNPLISFLIHLERFSARFADHVITVTHLWQNTLTARSTPSDKCTVLLNVPDTNVFRFNKNRKHDGNTFNLYYHGSLEEHFGVDTLIEAMPLIIEHVPQARLHIYAAKRGRSFDQYVEQAKQSNLTGCIYFHRGVPFHELPKVLADADIGVVPTKNSTFADEAVSMKSFEYIFSGIPIVISKTTAHSYYYNDSMVTFFEPCNSKDLALAVVDLFRHQTRRREQVHNSLPFIEKETWSKAKIVYQDLVTKLTGGMEGAKDGGKLP